MNQDFTFVRHLVQEVRHVLPEKLWPTFGRDLPPRGMLTFEQLGAALFALAFNNAERTADKKNKHTGFTFNDDPLNVSFMYLFHVKDLNGVITYLTVTQRIKPGVPVVYEVHITCDHGDEELDRAWMDEAKRHDWRYDTEPTPTGAQEETR